MSDDKKNVFTLVPKVDGTKAPAGQKLTEEYLGKREEMIEHIKGTDRQHLMMTVDENGLCNFLTDLDFFAASFFLEKVKYELQMQYDDEVLDRLDQLNIDPQD